MLDQRAGLTRGDFDLVDRGGCLVGVGKVLDLELYQLGIANNRHQHIVEIMRNRAGKNAHGLHFPHLCDLFSHSLPFRNTFADADIVGDLAVFARQRQKAGCGLPMAAIFT